jgi:hypothetical protein
MKPHSLWEHVVLKFHFWARHHTHCMMVWLNIQWHVWLLPGKNLYSHIHDFYILVMFITIQTKCQDLKFKFEVLFSPPCISLGKDSLNWHSLRHRICRKFVHSRYTRLDLWWGTYIQNKWFILEWWHDGFMHKAN